MGSTFYTGQKESELISARNLLKDNDLPNFGLPLDALHCQVDTLMMVLGQGGVYVVEAKANQETLCDDLADHFYENALYATTPNQFKP